MAGSNNMVSSDAEQIKKMASAIRDMSNDMKAFNNEMNATVKLISRMQSQVKSASRTASAESRKRTREEMNDEQRLEQWRYKEEVKRRQNTRDIQEKTKDRAGKAGLGIVVALFRASFKELQKQNAELRKLNQQFGGTTGGNTLYLGKHMQTQASYDVAKNSVDLMKSNNNALKWLTDGIKKLYTGIVEYSGILKQAIQITQQQMATIAQMQGSQAGISYGASGQMYHTARSIALMRMRALNPDRSDESLLSDEMYQQIYNSLLSAMISGGAVANTGYTTEGWEGWAFENLGWSPNVDYSSEAQADARRRYLEMLANLDNDEKAAEQIKYYKNQSRLLKSIAGQLFSFDEVESQQAISMEDSVDATNMYGEDITEKLRNQEELLDELAKKYGLSYEQVQNIRKILTDTDLSLSDIALLLAAGISFDDDSTTAIIDMATRFGLSTEEIIKAYNMYDNDLSKAAEELRKMAEQGIDVHVYLHDKEGYLQADYDTTTATGSSQEHEIGRGSSNENYYKNLLEEMADEELKERDPAGWERKHAFESLTDGGTHPAGKEFPSFYSPTFATGGIGTSKITDATLFEKGPEAVIPLTTDIGKQFMADAIQTAIGDTNIGGDTINVKIDGPVFTESERQLNKWATEFGDRYAQIKARRGGK